MLGSPRVQMPDRESTDRANAQAFRREVAKITASALSGRRFTEIEFVELADCIGDYITNGSGRR
jgi:hypothetical protein